MKTGITTQPGTKLQTRILFRLSNFRSLRNAFAELKYRKRLLKARLLRKYPGDNKTLFSVYSLFNSRRPDPRALRKYLEVKKKTTPKIVLFTAMTGDYDTLKLPDILDTELDYVIFTDQNIENYGVFDVRQMPFTKTDPGRQVRYVKTQPSLIFPGYDIAIWVDASIKILGDIKPLIEAFVRSGKQIACIPHPVRDTIYEEGEACIALKKGDANTIRKQLEHYKREGFQHDDLAAGGLLMFQLHDKKSIYFQKTWWKEITTYSGRDQLSLNYALVKSKAQWHRLMERPNNAGTHPLFAIAPHKRKAPHG